MPGVARAEIAHWLCGERFGRRLAPRIGRLSRVGLSGETPGRPTRTPENEHSQQLAGIARSGRNQPRSSAARV